MTRCIVFANQKGGCGKTTSAVNTAHCLAAKGRKVLLIDLDPQAHTSISLGKNPDILVHGIYDLLTGQAGLNRTINKTDIKNLYIIPSSSDLTGFEIDFSTCKGSQNILSEKILSQDSKFDYLIIDPPPAIGLLTVSALVAVKEVYIPMPMHFLAMEGLTEMIRLIYKVNALWNPELCMKGIIPTFYNKNTRLAKEITEEICKNFGQDRLLPGIRMNVSLAEAPGHGKTIIEYAPQSSGAKDYMTLAEKIDRE